MTDVIIDLLISFLGIWFFAFRVFNLIPERKMHSNFWQSVVYIGFLLSVVSMCWCLVRFLSWLLL